jgi:hypothetical protein
MPTSEGFVLALQMCLWNCDRDVHRGTPLTDKSIHIKYPEKNDTKNSKHWVHFEMNFEKHAWKLKPFKELT